MSSAWSAKRGCRARNLSVSLCTARAQGWLGRPGLNTKWSPGPDGRNPASRGYGGQRHDAVGTPNAGGLRVKHHGLSAGGDVGEGGVAGDCGLVRVGKRCLQH